MFRSILTVFLLACVQLAAAALSGSYSVGPSGDFASLTEAVDSLQSQGVEGLVKFEVTPGVYEGPLTIGGYSGSGEYEVTFTPSPQGTVDISNTDPTAPSLWISGVKRLRLEGFTATSSSSSQPAVRVSGTGSDIVLHGCFLRGTGGSRIVEILGATMTDVSLVKCTLRGGGDGVFLSAPTNSSHGHRVLSCEIDSVNRGVVAERQNDLRIEDCFIRPNAGSSSGVTGIHVGPQNPLDSVFVLRNDLSEFRTSSGYAVAVRHSPLENSARLLCVGNMIHGFQNTGTSQVRAIYMTGGANSLVNNSVLIPDVAATGTAYSVYNGLTSPDASLELVNNILANHEATRPAYNLFVLTTAGILVSKHNLFHGTGTAYRVGWWLGDYPTLAEWQAATGLDVGSLQGDPLFVSESDLHLQSSSELPHQNGAVALLATRDMDQELRFQPPDIGADEYMFDAPPFDGAILDLPGLPAGVPELTSVTIQAVVQNRGSQELTDMPVQLMDSGFVRAEVLINLPPSVTDTISLTWTTGVAGDTATPLVHLRLDGDANPQDNDLAFSVQITAAALIGTYQIGSAPSDYPSIGSALDDLMLRGVAGPVTFDIAQGEYAEHIVLTPFPGMSEQNVVMLRKNPSHSGTVRVTTDDEEPVVRLSGAMHVQLENLILNSGDLARETVLITSGASHNVLRGCTIQSASLNDVTASCVAMGSGCHDNLIENCVLTSCYHGIKAEGGSTSSDTGNVIRQCVLENVRTGIYVSRQHGMVIEQCQISAGYAGAPGPCYGIRVATQFASDTVFVRRNKLFGGSSTGAQYTLRNESVSGTVVAVNNWIGDYDSTGTGSVTALSCVSGATLFWHNSVDIGELSGSGTATAISISGSQSSADLRNNVFSIRRANGDARMIYWTDGVLTSDYNLFETPGTNPDFRFAYSSLDDDIQTLAAWAAETQLDSSSVATAAGFVSVTDYHIRPDASGPSNRGLLLPLAQADYDGQTRSATPDLGADEYTYVPSVIDVTINSLTTQSLPLPSGGITTLQAEVENVGQLAAPYVLASLRYNGVSLGSQFFALAIGESRVVTWQWALPVSDLETGTLDLRMVVPGDAVEANNRLYQSVVIAGAPLASQISVGPGETLATISDLAQHLKWRGISEDFTARLRPGTYAESVEFASIPGTSTTSRVLIEPEIAGTVSLVGDVATSAVVFDHAQFVELHDIGILADPEAPAAVEIRTGSCFNALTSCGIVGPGLAQVNGHGVLLSGQGCVGNTIAQCQISNAFVGIGMTGDDFDLSQDNLITGCTISEMFYGVWLDHQQNAQVINNQIVPGSNTGPASACYGVYLVQLGTGGSARIEGNRIHGFLDSPGPNTNRACGIYSAQGASSTVEIVNNFVYGFSALTTLRVRAIYLSSGTHLVAHNSIRLDNTAANNLTSGIYVSTGAEHQILNNCVLSYESDVASKALELAAGASVISDYNCLWGNSAQFSIADSGGIAYPTLSSWQALGHDAQSVNARPDYVSSTDLHLTDQDTVCYAAGLALPEVPLDIDGEVRDNTPCIGADESFPDFTLPAPNALAISQLSETEWRLTWSAVAGASQYRVYFSHTSEGLFLTPELLTVTPNTSAIITIDEFSPESMFLGVRAE
ncbi:MAG: right-handed parallel beta-helix repeat-containing protein [Calditrichaeota bacterium]|nr:right-handed parallel beta-helix repeat-containing protein [Calditrichota bacterium]MCB9365922.1 right-handed parallel beta-helix repeat-containing protein [Calditrichota bacterium]